jgi:hypothetical protein
MYKKGIVSLEKVDKTYRYQTNPSCLKEISAIWKKQKSIETAIQIGNCKKRIDAGIYEGTLMILSMQ